MLGTAFLLEGEEMARMAVVIATFTGLVRHHMRAGPSEPGKTQMTMSLKETPSVGTWGILALSGLLGSGWN